MSDARDIINAIGGTIAVDRGGDTAIQGIVKKTVTVAGFAFEADDNTQRQVLFKNTTGHTLRLLTAEYVPEAAVTADNTNYSTVTLIHTDTPASGTGTAASMQTTIAAGTDDWVANTPETLTNSSTAANLLLEDDEYALVLLDGTNGTGVDLPIGTWVLDYEFV